jgi:integrase
MSETVLLGPCRAAKVCLIHQVTASTMYKVTPENGGVEDVAIKKVFDELIQSKRAGNRREVYVKSLSYYVSRFVDYAGAESKIGSVTSSQVEEFISSFTGYARQTWLNRISTLFSFAVRRGYVDRNPCDRIDRVRIDRNPPVILTVEQAKTLLLSCSTLCKPYLVLGMFAGIRPDEIHRLDWSQINLDTATAKVDGKTRQRRIVALEPVVIKYLKDHPIKTGPVAPSKETARRFKRKARACLGGKWTADILRHTAASYLLGKYQDAGKVAMQLGNSPKILLSHYHDPVTKEECEKFWNL